jgi:hypothetical protein
MNDPLTHALLVIWLHTCAAHFGLDPHWVQAVATVESRPKGGSDLEMRFGRLGKTKFYGMGVNSDCFRDKENVKNPWLCIYWGVKALARYPGDRVRSLRKYNTNYNHSYAVEIKRIEKLLREGEK